MLVADTLSCTSLPDTTPEIPAKELNVFVNSVIKNILSDKRLHQFQSET